MQPFVGENLLTPSSRSINSIPLGNTYYSNQASSQKVEMAECYLDSIL
jgi:hypothetical protein